jgi:hypothetical protein
MQLAGAVLEVRERVLDVVRDAAALPCSCAPGRACLGCRARMVLEYLTAVGFRMQRWRNPPGPIVRQVHVAGPIIDCREYRRSCPGFIVDRRQTCLDCGVELCRGRWAIFFAVGQPAAILRSRTGAQGGIVYAANGQPGEISCPGRPAVLEGSAAA